MDNDDLQSFQGVDLADYLSRAEIIKQTALQLIKDFESAGFEVTFSGNEINAYDELFVQVECLVTNLITVNFEKLMQLLYRIDVSEKKINAPTTINETYSEKISRLIIYRELQKVIIRNYLKK